MSTISLMISTRPMFTLEDYPMCDRENIDKFFDGCLRQKVSIEFQSQVGPSADRSRLTSPTYEPPITTTFFSPAIMIAFTSTSA